MNQKSFNNPYCPWKYSIPMGSKGMYKNQEQMNYLNHKSNSNISTDEVIIVENNSTKISEVISENKSHAICQKETTKYFENFSNSSNLTVFPFSINNLITSRSNNESKMHILDKDNTHKKLQSAPKIFVNNSNKIYFPPTKTSKICGSVCSLQNQQNLKTTQANIDQNIFKKPNPPILSQVIQLKKNAVNLKGQTTISYYCSNNKSKESLYLNGNAGNMGLTITNNLRNQNFNFTANNKAKTPTYCFDSNKFKNIICSSSNDKFIDQKCSLPIISTNSSDIHMDSGLNNDEHSVSTLDERKINHDVVVDRPVTPKILQGILKDEIDFKKLLNGSNFENTDEKLQENISTSSSTGENNTKMIDDCKNVIDEPKVVKKCGRFSISNIISSENMTFTSVSLEETGIEPPTQNFCVSGKKNIYKNLNSTGSLRYKISRNHGRNTLKKYCRNAINTSDDPRPIYNISYIPCQKKKIRNLSKKTAKSP